ncbi:MAG: vanadium-dependent haloperoxidase [Gemmatimonadetes bacterium]|nr:vanadium-dependent haloperoxidase [Gemmatimonadota bacterium]
MAQLPRREEERRLAALGIRQQAAELAAERPRVADDNNGDETNYDQPGYVPPNSGWLVAAYQPFTGNFSKGLRHDEYGDPEPVSYGSLLRALESRDPDDFRQILVGFIADGARRMKLTNPQAGFAFNLEGPDSQEPTIPPAPRFDSAVEAHEQGELYWMAVARDVYFGSYGSDPLITAAINSLNSEFPQFGGTVPVTPQNVFRGIYPGEQVGPYVSQFLLKGNADPRKATGQGRNSTDGYIAYGSQVIDQRQQTVQGYPELGAAADYLTDFAWWLRAQNGEDFRGNDQFDFTTRRFIRNLRDGANYVHFDLVINAWYNAAWLLLSEPMSNGVAPDAGAVPMRDREFPKDTGNPYEPPAPSSPTESGFCTFGDPHVIEVLTEVTGRACRTVWWQKWGVHRRLRPEEYGGRVQNQISGTRTYPIDRSIVDSLTSGGLAPYFGSTVTRYPSYLLPQAFPEGAPAHPAYGAGHATISGACATILKAFFDESKVIEYPVLASSDGLSLLQYTGSDAGQIRVGGELNKLAGNIALFRNAAGVHWRSDYTQSLLLGEKVAIGLLQELSITFNEDDAYFQLTRFDGTTIRIQGGFVDVVPAVAGS